MMEDLSIRPMVVVGRPYGCCGTYDMAGAWLDMDDWSCAVVRGRPFMFTTPLVYSRVLFTTLHHFTTLHCITNKPYSTEYPHQCSLTHSLLFPSLLYN
jgi:hypothetical protein